MIERLRNRNLVVALVYLSCVFIFVNLHEKSNVIKGIGAGCTLSRDELVVATNGTWSTASNESVIASMADEDFTKQWCPKAKCGFNGRCDLCQRRFLVVLASGRSASTTLTWMLDLLPGIRMAGENDDLLQKLRLIEKETLLPPSYGRKDAWGRNPVPDGVFGCAVQELLEVSNPPQDLGLTQEYLRQTDRNTIIGFKTIRFHKNLTIVKNNPKREFRAKTLFLRRYFPCARFVINIRSDVDAQLESRDKFFVDSTSSWSSKAIVQHEMQGLRRMAEVLGSQAMLMDSSEWTRDIHKLNALLDWLGFNEACHFSELLELNTRSGFANSKTELQVNPACRLRPV